MKLNCKPGDLAVIVVSPETPENVGKIVRCIRRITEAEPVDGMTWTASTSNTWTWLVETEGSRLLWGIYGQVPRRAYADHCLRPIRDQPGADETLRWADVPREGVPA